MEFCGVQRGLGEQLCRLEIIYVKGETETLENSLPEVKLTVEFYEKFVKGST